MCIGFSRCAGNRESNQKALARCGQRGGAERPGRQPADARACRGADLALIVGRAGRRQDELPWRRSPTPTAKAGYEVDGVLTAKPPTLSRKRQGSPTS